MARLLQHRIAAEVVDVLYNDYATATQRGELMQELYGNVHALGLAQNQVHSLKHALELNHDKQSLILDNLARLLTTMANKYALCQVFRLIE